VVFDSSKSGAVATAKSPPEIRRLRRVPLGGLSTKRSLLGRSTSLNVCSPGCCAFPLAASATAIVIAAKKPR
jgi:hypothetical protein